MNNSSNRPCVRAHMRKHTNAPTPPPDKAERWGWRPNPALCNGLQGRGQPLGCFSRVVARLPGLSTACGQTQATHTAHSAWRFSGKFSVRDAPDLELRVGLHSAQGSQLEVACAGKASYHSSCGDDTCCHCWSLTSALVTPLGGAGGHCLPGRRGAQGGPSHILSAGLRALQAWRPFSEHQGFSG